MSDKLLQPQEVDRNFFGDQLNPFSYWKAFFANHKIFLQAIIKTCIHVSAVRL